MIHLYCGNGKGKTTAAFGLAMRQLGYQKKVLIIQFLKDGCSGEVSFIRQLPLVSVHASPLPKMFFMQMDEKQQAETRVSQHSLWKKLCSLIEDYDYILLDEVIDAINLGLLSEEEIIAFIATYKDTKEIVVTGRNPSAQMIALSDYYTEFVGHKHPYQTGVGARKGIEY